MGPFDVKLSGLGCHGMSSSEMRLYKDEVFARRISWEDWPWTLVDSWCGYLLLVAEGCLVVVWRLGQATRVFIICICSCLYYRGSAAFIVSGFIVLLVSCESLCLIGHVFLVVAHAH